MVWGLTNAKLQPRECHPHRITSQAADSQYYRIDEVDAASPHSIPHDAGESRGSWRHGMLKSKQDVAARRRIGMLTAHSAFSTKGNTGIRHLCSQWTKETLLLLVWSRPGLLDKSKTAKCEFVFLI